MTFLADLHSGILDQEHVCHRAGRGMGRVAGDANGGILRVNATPLGKQGMVMIVEVLLRQHARMAAGTIGIGKRLFHFDRFRIISAVECHQILRARHQAETAPDDSLPGMALDAQHTLLRVKSCQIRGRGLQGTRVESFLGLGVAGGAKIIVLLFLRPGDVRRHRQNYQRRK